MDVKQRDHEKSDLTYIVFRGSEYSGIDFKMNVPQSLLNVTLPMKMKEWFKAMVTYMQKDYANEHK